MSEMKTNPQSLPGRRWSVVLVMLLGPGLTGCEAPLDLSLVEQEIKKPVHRFDQLKAAAVNHRRIVVVGDYGTVLSTTDQGTSWQRTRLPTRASLLAVASCNDGRFIAIDTVRNAWISDREGGDWRQRTLGTQESPMTVACDPRGRFWVGASFSTLISSDDGGESWQERSQDEDMLFTHIQWLDADNAVVAGEFGALYFSHDGGESWERGNDIPNEFYPMAAHFNSLDEGWVAGLSGTILYTADGGLSWDKQPADSKAPIYSLIAHDERLYATGDSGTLLQLDGSEWRSLPDLPRMFSYLITAVPVGEEKLLVTGGRGNLSPIVIADSGDQP
jgi:photosystem II stability/assembly factor-like uncharacterized protein